MTQEYDDCIRVSDELNNTDCKVWTVSKTIIDKDIVSFLD
jgi:hypothetical protein